MKTGLGKKDWGRDTIMNNDPETVVINRSSMQVGGFYGLCQRDEFTGKVYFKERADASDFQLVDTFYRGFPIIGSSEEMVKDPYLFKPVAMPFRSWAYQERCKDTSEDGKSKEEHLVDSLMMKCDDRNLIHEGGLGTWSPFMTYSWLLFPLTCMKDTFVLSVAVAIFLVLLVLTRLCNTPRLYRFIRVLSIPPRAVLAYLCFEKFDDNLKEQGQWLAYFMTIAVLSVMVVDFLIGDMMMLYSFVYGRRLYVHHKLSPNVFLCSEKVPGWKQVGKKYKDVQYEAMKKKMPRKDIWGDLWQKDTMLIAEIHGVICQLKFVYMENWYVLKHLPSVNCYALRGLFDHR